METRSCKPCLCFNEHGRIRLICTSRRLTTPPLLPTIAHDVKLLALQRNNFTHIDIGELVTFYPHLSVLDISQQSAPCVHVTRDDSQSALRIYGDYTVLI